MAKESKVEKVAEELEATGNAVAEALDDVEETLQPEPEVVLKVSATLHKQICLKAKKEGIDPSQLASELLSEGLVLRAWEIMERKVAMRGGSSGNSMQNGSRPNQGRHRNDKQRRHNHNNNKGGRPNAMNLMEDKAAFMEYLRNQERNRR